MQWLTGVAGSRIARVAAVAVVGAVAENTVGPVHGAAVAVVQLLNILFGS